MSEIGDAINEIREELATESSEFMADVCDLMLVSTTPGTAGGQTTTSSTVASDIPCSYRVLSVPIERQIAGSGITSLTHKLKMPSTAQTQAITPRNRIIVAARGDTPELTFEHPTLLSGSLDPFVTVAASLRQ